MLKICEAVETLPRAKRNRREGTRLFQMRAGLMAYRRSADALSRPRYGLGTVKDCPNRLVADPKIGGQLCTRLSGPLE
jgi:hypothetical protein